MYLCVSGKKKENYVCINKQDRDYISIEMYVQVNRGGWLSCKCSGTVCTYA
jgi:hypothetical protein